MAEALSHCYLWTNLGSALLRRNLESQNDLQTRYTESESNVTPSETVVDAGCVLVALGPAVA